MLFYTQVHKLFIYKQGEKRQTKRDEQGKSRPSVNMMYLQGSKCVYTMWKGTHLHTYNTILFSKNKDIFNNFVNKLNHILK